VGVGDNPNQAHGRLNEALHHAGYAYERAIQKLKWLLADSRWREVGDGFDDINAFLASIQPPEHIKPTDRKEIAALIRAAEPAASQRKIAGALGVSPQTVGRDLDPVPSGTPAEATAATNKASEPPSVPSGTPAPEPAGDVVAREAAERKEAAERREQKRAEQLAALENTANQESKAARGVYDVVVIDPPWPMEKIERDVRPNQTVFDYPTMSEDEIAEHVLDQAPFADDCHVWLWTTQKFLPMAFRLLDQWGLKYVCAFTWHKPGGFQPVGLPQYNCEFALYARRGAPVFVETSGFPVCFTAPRGAHSEKPSKFYDTVARVTIGRRLDMFNRRQIPGFDGHGKEAA